MNIKEMECKLAEEGLLEVHFDDGIKKYIDGRQLYYDNILHNCVDVFGIYKSKSGKHIFFITESERGGISKYRDVCETEEDACESLLKYIYREERIYKKKHDSN